MTETHLRDEVALAHVMLMNLKKTMPHPPAVVLVGYCGVVAVKRKKMIVPQVPRRDRVVLALVAVPTLKKTMPHPPADRVSAVCCDAAVMKRKKMIARHVLPAVVRLKPGKMRRLHPAVVLAVSGDAAVMKRKKMIARRREHVRRRQEPQWDHALAQWDVIARRSQLADSPDLPAVDQAHPVHRHAVAVNVVNQHAAAANHCLVQLKVASISRIQA